MNNKNPGYDFEENDFNVEKVEPLIGSFLLIPPPHSKLLNSNPLQNQR